MVLLVESIAACPIVTFVPFEGKHLRNVCFWTVNHLIWQWNLDSCGWADIAVGLTLLLPVIYLVIFDFIVFEGKPIATDGEHVLATTKHENCSLWVKFYSNDDIVSSVTWYKINDNGKQKLGDQNGKMVLETRAEMVDVKYYGTAVKHHGNRTQLLLQNIDEGDFGDYEVEIQNSIGHITWKFTLIMQGKKTCH